MDYLTLYFEHPACDIYYNNELNAVQTRWKGSFLHGEEFRKVLNNITEVLIEKKVHIIIADARKMKIITPEDQQWIVDDWYPRTTKAGFNFEALIITKHTFNERSIKQIVQHYDERKVQTVYFYSYKQAAHWIIDNIGSMAF